MSKIQDARMKLSGELEAPPALRRFGSADGFAKFAISVARHPVPLGYLSQFKYPFRRKPKPPEETP